MLKIDSRLPTLKKLSVLKAESILPALPTLKMLPALPMLRMLPTLPMLRILPVLAMLRIAPLRCFCDFIAFYTVICCWYSPNTIRRL